MQISGDVPISGPNSIKLSKSDQILCSRQADQPPTVAPAPPTFRLSSQGLWSSAPKTDIVSSGASRGSKDRGCLVCPSVRSSSFHGTLSICLRITDSAKKKSIRNPLLYSTEMRGTAESGASQCESPAQRPGHEVIGGRIFPHAVQSRAGSAFLLLWTISMMVASLTGRQNCSSAACLWRPNRKQIRAPAQRVAVQASSLFLEHLLPAVLCLGLRR